MIQVRASREIIDQPTKQPNDQPADQPADQLIVTNHSSANSQPIDLVKSWENPGFNIIVKFNNDDLTSIKEIVRKSGHKGRLLALKTADDVRGHIIWRLI